jgi:GT2 family glycosyltransferase
MTYPNYETVVVDNGSSGNDAQGALKARFADVVRVRENKQNLGFTRGNNVGTEYAVGTGAEYIMLLDNVTTIDSEFLVELVKGTESDEDITAVYPKVCCYEEPEKIWLAFNNIDFY